MPPAYGLGRTFILNKVSVLLYSADLMYYVENTQAQYFDKLISYCTRFISTMAILLCIKFSNIKALFLAALS